MSSDSTSSCSPTLADMHDRLQDPTIVHRVRDTGGRVTLAIFDCTKPVIGAINGAAVGIGATMTLAMDIRLASDKARIGFVFGKIGIVPEACSSWFLPRIVGMQQALEWVYTRGHLRCAGGEARRAGEGRLSRRASCSTKRGSWRDDRRQPLAGRDRTDAPDDVSQRRSAASARGASHRLARRVLHEREGRQGRRARVPGKAPAELQVARLDRSAAVLRGVDSTAYTKRADK